MSESTLEIKTARMEVDVTHEVGDYLGRVQQAERRRSHSHYYKDVSHLQTIDVYRVLCLFGVTDPCLQHAIKKLLVAGGRGAGKDVSQDIQEAIDSLQRMQFMMDEDSKKS